MVYTHDNRLCIHQAWFMNYFQQTTRMLCHQSLKTHTTQTQDDCTPVLLAVWSQQTRHIETMIVQCWASVADGGTTLNHHCFNVPCLWDAIVCKTVSILKNHDIPMILNLYSLQCDLNLFQFTFYDYFMKLIVYTCILRKIINVVDDVRIFTKHPEQSIPLSSLIVLGPGL